MWALPDGAVLACVTPDPKASENADKTNIGICVGLTMDGSAKSRVKSSKQQNTSAPSFQRHISADGREYYEALDGPSRGQTVWALPDGAVLACVNLELQDYPTPD